MISAEEFLDILEENRLLAPELVSSLRTRVVQSMAPISAALLAQRLVEKGHLSRETAQRILDRAEDVPAGEDTGSLDAEEPEEEELGLVPLDEDELPRSRRGRSSQPEPTPVEPEPIEPVPIEPIPVEPEEMGLMDDDQPVPVVPPAATPPESKPAPAAPSPPTSDEPAQFVDLPEEAPRPEITPRDPLAGVSVPTIGGGRKRRKKGNVWDTKLMLIGGGSLIVLVILMFTFYWATAKRSPQEMFDAAEADYRAGAYAQAISKYDDFLEKYANKEREKASIARVQQAMCRLRQVTDSGSDWPAALEVAREQTERVSGEKAFGTEGRPELEAMLPTIAEGLAARANELSTEEAVALAEDGVALLMKYIPPSARPVQRLRDIEASLALTNRQIAREDTLVATVAEMKQAIAGKEAVDASVTQAAYALRRALLKEYPSLVNEPRLVAAVQAISASEMAATERLEDLPGTLDVGQKRADKAAVILANRAREKDAATEPGTVVFVLAAGAIYGLDGVGGEVLWRRPTGIALGSRAPAFQALPVSEMAGADVILVDRARREVFRVEAAGGEERWRLGVGEPFDSEPVVHDGRLWISTRSGKLLMIDLASGDALDGVQFPQSLRVGPAIDGRRQSVYQCGEHSTLFVLSTSDATPKRAVYLGHAPGTIVVPPVAIGSYLIVAENREQDSSVLKVLCVDRLDDETPAFSVLQEVVLEGHVSTPVVAAGARLLCVTDAGTSYVFDVNGTAEDEPLGLMAESTTGNDQGAMDAVRRFALVRGGQVWIADTELSRYDIQASRGRLTPKKKLNGESITLQPPRLVGASIFHVRRKLGMPGVWVSAINAESGAPCWETYLATGLAATPRVDPADGRLTCVTSLGAVYKLDTAPQPGAGALPEPVESLGIAELSRPVTDIVAHDGLVALVSAGGSPRIPVYNPESKSGLRQVTLPDVLTNAPIEFAGGLLAPCASGQVHLIDMQSGEELAEPFQPRLEAGTVVRWRKPLRINDKEFVLADAESNVYHVGLRGDPTPHLSELASAQTPAAIRSHLAVLGETVYAVDDERSLLAVRLPRLDTSVVQELSGRCVWGPHRVGDHVLLSTDDDVLYSIDASGEVSSESLPQGPLVGEPLAVDDAHVLASVSGMVCWRRPEPRGVIAEVDVGRPLGTGPLALESGVLVGGADGSLYVLQRPKAEP